MQQAKVVCYASSSKDAFVWRDEHRVLEVRCQKEHVRDGIEITVRDDGGEDYAFAMLPGLAVELLYSWLEKRGAGPDRYYGGEGAP